MAQLIVHDTGAATYIRATIRSWGIDPDALTGRELIELTYKINVDGIDIKYSDNVSRPIAWRRAHDLAFQQWTEPLAPDPRKWGRPSNIPGGRAMIAALPPPAPLKEKHRPPPEPEPASP